MIFERCQMSKKYYKLRDLLIIEPNLEIHEVHDFKKLIETKRDYLLKATKCDYILLKSKEDKIYIETKEGEIIKPEIIVYPPSDV